MGEVINTPELISSAHDIKDFSSGENSLDHWLKHRALKNNRSGASRTFVVTTKKHKVIAYYCLSAGSVQQADAPGKIKRNMPDPIPVMVLGRLAVDMKWQAKGIGHGLLKDAVLRTIKVSKDAGIRALLVHALSDSARFFYKKYGFIESPSAEMTLMLSLKGMG